MEERRGESSDVWMKQAGQQYTAVDDAHQAVSRECDIEGIDPSLSLPERVARLQDIHQGSPLMAEERQRKQRIAEPQQKPKTFGDIFAKELAPLGTLTR